MKRLLKSIDWLILIPAFCLVALSLIVLESINPAYFQSQTFTFIIAILAFIFFSQFPYKTLSSLSSAYYVVSIVLLAIVLLLGIESRGAVRWLEIGGFRLQLSEICKPILSISFAYFLSKTSNKSLKTYLLSLVYFIPIIVLIYLQPDLGNALLYLGVGMLVLIVFGIPFRWILLTIAPFIISFPLLWEILHDYQKQRIFTFFNPLHDPKGSSYNLIQAIIAVGSGMILGKGIGEGTQSSLKFLPENHTDFIFASLAEKLGFLGSIIVLITFVFLLYRLYVVFLRCDNIFGKLYTACAFLFILLHVFVNIGMNLGLVPVVGVTLPFVSFGGSSLLANFIMLGIVSSISITSRKREILEIR